MVSQTAGRLYSHTHLAMFTHCLWDVAVFTHEQCRKGGYFSSTTLCTRFSELLTISASGFVFPDPFGFRKKCFNVVVALAPNGTHLK